MSTEEPDEEPKRRQGSRCWRLKTSFKKLKRAEWHRQGLWFDRMQHDLQIRCDHYTLIAIESDTKPWVVYGEFETTEIANKMDLMCKIFSQPTLHRREASEMDRDASALAPGETLYWWDAPHTYAARVTAKYDKWKQRAQEAEVHCEMLLEQLEGLEKEHPDLFPKTTWVRDPPKMAVASVWLPTKELKKPPFKGNPLPYGK